MPPKPPPKTIVITVSRDGISPAQVDANQGDTISFVVTGANPPTKASAEMSFTVTGPQPTLFAGDGTFALPGTYTVKDGGTFYVTAGDKSAEIDVYSDPPPPTVITVSAHAIKPAHVELRAGDEVSFVPSGHAPPTSLTVTSRNHAVADTALFGGAGNTYPVPSTQTIQGRTDSQGHDVRQDDTFTITAGAAHAVIVAKRSLGDPMQQTNNTTK
jgi:plastocyanin